MSHPEANYPFIHRFSLSLVDRRICFYRFTKSSVALKFLYLVIAFRNAGADIPSGPVLFMKQPRL
ncbi:MAG: hypothetical protein AAF399_29185, partial [Bacteroidota bacterium]